MVKDIVKDVLFLNQKSKDVTIDDLYIGVDLLDTLEFHKHECVGMAANMIGYHLNAIVFLDEKTNSNKVMYNPKIVSQKDEYETEEGCLSLPGKRKTKRYDTIVVEYQNQKLQSKKGTYHGFTAEIIQHEIDMCNGILI